MGDAPWLVGRSDELRECRRFVDASLRGLAALELVGPAGIGKSTVLEATVAQAQERGATILRTRPAPSEARLALSGIWDLFRDVPREALASLPPVQARAVEVALLLREPEPGTDADWRATAAGCLGIVEWLTARSAVLFVVDDLQWLDPSSARVVEAVVRRLSEDDRVGVLVARRSPPDVAPPIDLAAALQAVDRLDLQPLDRGELIRIVEGRLGAGLPVPDLDRIARTSSGNPFFALELARHRSLHPGEQPELPPSVLGLLDLRLAALSARARRCLLAAAELHRPTLELVSAVVPPASSALAGLEEAEERGVVSLDRGAVVFTHPLYLAAARGWAGEAERRALHARLAQVVADPEERVRHLALALPGPDEDVAGQLDAAAEHASARGAPDAAYELARLAVELTPSGSPHAFERSLRAIEHGCYLADHGAVEALGSVAAETPRQRARIALARVRYEVDDVAEARELMRAALAQPGLDAPLTAELHANLAQVLLNDGDLATASSEACAVLALDDVPAGVRSLALAVLGFVEGATGSRGTPTALRGAGPEDPGDGFFYFRPDAMHAMWSQWVGAHEASRRGYLELIRRSEELGDAFSATAGRFHLAEVEIRAGNWRRARELMYEHRDLVLRAQMLNEGSVDFGIAYIEALRGDHDVARRHAEAGLARSRDNSDLIWTIQNLSVLGYLDLVEVGADEAVERFAEVTRHIGKLGIGEPGCLPMRHWELDALVEAGRYEEARERADALRVRGEELDRPYAVGLAARTGARLAGAVGELDRAAELAAHAIQEHLRAREPFDVARDHLVLGEVLRRRLDRGRARHHLQTARDRFSALGAAHWAAVATGELARVGGRTAHHDELTATERTIAELAATGMTNREIAERAFVTAKTVEGHLTRVYRKLGVRSRTELAASWAPEVSSSP